MFGKGDPEENEDPLCLWEFSRLFVEEFEKLTEPYGGICCHDIVGVDWTDLEQVKQFSAGEDGRKQRCFDLVGETARMLGEILEDM
jgi:hypothetical protein